MRIARNKFEGGFTDSNVAAEINKYTLHVEAEDEHLVASPVVYEC